MTNTQMIRILLVILCFFVIALFALIIIAFIKWKKINNNNKKDVEIKTNNKKESKADIFRSYSRDSIYKFMEFESIEDNMIIQKKDKRFLMVIECQGINYDLMSNMEKISIEEGFLQFLNSLRHPIQIYIQSRTINLEKSIGRYRKKVNEENMKLNKMMMEYEQMQKNPNYSDEKRKKYNFEIIKQRNLCEYGKDIIENTEKMNLNKNILTKKYYIIVPYNSDEIENDSLDNEEIKNNAFSDLYTRAQNIIRTLFVCNINARILNSTELIELLYVAYNRDESETYDIEKVIQAGCEDIYSTAPDVLDKKIKELDNQIQNKAYEMAEEAFLEVKSEKEKELKEKENNIDDLIERAAKLILEKSKQDIGTQMAEEAKVKIDNNSKSRKSK